MEKRISLSMVLSLLVFMLSTFPAIGAIEDINIHGFISQGYLYATDDRDYMAEGVGDGTFQFNEIAINFGTSLTDELKIGIQLLAFDLGHIGNDEVVVDWAFADYRYQDWLGFRAGLVKIPHGLYNETRDIDFLRTPVFLSESLYGELFRGAFSRMKGAGIYGYLPYGFSYQLIYGVIATDLDGGLTLSFESFFGLEAEDVQIKDAGAFAVQWSTPVDGLRLGANIYGVRDYVISGTYDGINVNGLLLGQGSPIELDFESMTTPAASIEYAIGDLVLCAEYMQAILKLNLEVTDLLLNQKNEINMESYYGALSYRFSDWLLLGLMYSEVYLDKDSKSGRVPQAKASVDFRSEAYLKDLTLSLRFDLNENWIAKLEVHNMKGTLYVVSDVLDDDDEWLLYTAKLTFNF